MLIQLLKKNALILGDIPAIYYRVFLGYILTLNDAQNLFKSVL